MNRPVMITIPYQRACFNLAVSARMRTIKQKLAARMKIQRSALHAAIQDVTVYGVGLMLIVEEG